MRRLLLLMVAVALAACTPVRTTPLTPTTTTRFTEDRPLASVTPGATLAATAVQVCTPGWATAHRRSLSTKQKATVLAAYGLRGDQPVAEWDHLVPLELGGANGTRNIWPQLSPDDVRGKDRLEDRLHSQACPPGPGKLLLEIAQARIRQYWKEL